MKTKVKKQVELAELLSYVYGTYFGKEFEKQEHATRNFEEIQGAVINSNVEVNSS